MDVRLMIRDWERIRDSVPSQRLIEEMPSGYRSIAEIHYMSRQKTSWEVYVCLMGYHQETGADPNDVLREVESSVLTSQRSSSPTVDSFLRYSSEFMTVPRKEFLEVAIRIRRVFADQFIMTRSSTLDVLQECRAQHEPDWEEVWRCVREAGGGRSASAAAG